MLFPVRWLDPFGLAIIEILYLGAPVIGTRYGSLPEIITDEKVGFLSNNYNELIEAAHHVDQFDRRLCHQLAKEKFSSREMFLGYQTCYQRALDGEYLNSNTPYSAGGLTAPLPLH